MLSWLPVAPEATKVIGVPLTVMVSPAAKSVASESVAAAPDNSVAPVIGAGTAALLLTALAPVVAGGVTDGCMTVAQLSDDCTDKSFRPTGERSCGILVTVVVGDETVRRPMLPTPWSACRRSLIICVRPACVAVPLSMTSAGTV